MSDQSVTSGIRGPVTTQRLLTQENKLRELMDQLHEVIWQIIEPFKYGVLYKCSLEYMSV